METIPYTSIQGTALEIGVALGRLARPIMSAYLAQSSTWQALQPWRRHPRLQQLMTFTQNKLPDCWQELLGLARGLEMEVADVFLWNCRGDLLNKTPDGCTSIAINRSGNAMIAHNEDGDPFLHGHCHLVDVRPAGKPGFVSFYYPGSLPGHTFAVNRRGLVQTINNLRTLAIGMGLPRMMLCRAVLDAHTLDEAIDLLANHPRAGGFHHTLGCAGDSRMVSVEAAPQSCSVTPVSDIYGHANHMVHPASLHQAQIITASSRDRQTRLAQLLPLLSATPNEAELLKVLRDRGGNGLPIYRLEPDDPDEENTLATAVFRLTATEIQLQIFGKNAAPMHTLSIPVENR